jgi:hypothetical protein
MRKVIMDIVFQFVIIFIGFAFAWIPMLAWNYGIHSIFPTVFPKIGYFQAFFLQLLFTGIFSRPQFHNKE